MQHGLSRKSTLSSGKGSEYSNVKARFPNRTELINNLQHEMDKRSKVASEASVAPVSFKTTKSSRCVTEARNDRKVSTQIQFNIKKMAKGKVAFKD